jgi:hypothetical protein
MILREILISVNITMVIWMSINLSKFYTLESFHSFKYILICVVALFANIFALLNNIFSW